MRRWRPISSSAAIPLARRRAISGAPADSCGTSCSPEDMGMQEIRQFLLMLRERGESAASIKMYVASLHFLYGVTLGRPAVAANIPWPRVVQKLPAVVSREEVEALLGKIEPLKCRMVVMTAYGTGLRISEILAL